MKKRLILLFFIILGLIVLTACGGKSQEKVTDRLAKTVEGLSGYKANAEMKMNTGLDEQKYDIEVWHKRDGFYRVKLSNPESEQESQMILKNEDGVFVLTPGLNKSFKFQTEWPDNNSQAYLYHSLVNDILKDSEATFEVTDDHYVYQTKANYQNNYNMPSQVIYFDKKSLTPTLVQVLDKDENPIVEVTFTKFELNSNLTADDFKVEENMANALAELPVSKDENMDDENEEATFEVLFPLSTLGAELMDKKEVDLEDGKRILMVFSGEKSFTLIQEMKDVYPTLSTPYEVKGDIVNLGFTVGSLSDNTIEWSVNGVDYYLASDELTTEELIEVAQSVQGREVK